MKRIIIIVLSLVFLLVGCVDTAKDNNNYTVGNYSDYSFGIFSINGFKRAEDKFYFSYEIDPSQSETKEIKLNDLAYYIGESKTKIEKLSVQLEGKLYQGVYCVNTDQAASIDGISLDYDNHLAKWNCPINTISGGNISYIDKYLAAEKNNKDNTVTTPTNNLEQEQFEAQKQELEKQKQEVENQRKELEAQKQQQQANQSQQDAIKAEENSIGNAWNAVTQYGKPRYPNGFNLYYPEEILAEERDPDGSWYLACVCNITNAHGENYDTILEAKVRGTGQNWTVEQFYIDELD